MRSLKRNGNQYTWSSPLSTTFPAYVNPELSHKCYAQDRTYQMFIAPRSGWNGGFQRIIDTIPGRDSEYLSGPDIPPLASPYQMDIHCHGNLVYTARTTTSISIEQETEWLGRMKSHGKGKTDIFIYGGFVGDLFSEQRVLVLSTPGNDNVSRIYVDDNQFHIIGFTEGDIADNTITSLSDKLFFAGFSSFDIVSVFSTDAMAISYPFEIVPESDFVIRFSSIPTNRSATFAATITINAIPCTNVRWIGDALYAVSPPIINGNISVEFNQYSHIPRLSRMISSRRPSIVNMSPEVTDIAPFTTVRFTVLYMGLSELSGSTIFVGNQRCEIQIDGVVPDFFNGTVFNCSVPFESIGTKPVNFTTVDRTVFSNFTVTYRHIPQNISITIDEGQETPIILNCSAFSTLFNRFDYRVLKTPPNSYGLLLFENKTEFPNGSNVDVGDTLGRMRFRSTSHGRVDFRYYCLDGNSPATPLFGTVVVDIRPVIRCLNTVPTTGTFSLDDRSATPTNLTFTFLAVPFWGKLASDAEPFKLFEQGDTTAETSIRLNGRLAVNQYVC
ncbi:hypothetical protein BKA69DRAFT_1107127 [Paraphysoderma sedebokerense]|nr:hypothetical protein BKA69DRAFT_1107127 [Paraphysoderma sedebokerense]